MLNISILRGRCSNTKVHTGFHKGTPLHRNEGLVGTLEKQLHGASIVSGLTLYLKNSVAITVQLRIFFAMVKNLGTRF